MAELFRGLVTVQQEAPQGMITLRGDPGVLAGAVLTVTGASMPEVRRLARGEAGAVAWMAPDEVLVMVPFAQIDSSLAALEAALAGEFALVADFSDARAIFELRGAAWREVLARLCPVDFAPDHFGPGDIRRTRAAQVAAAVWCDAPDLARVMCFRSVAKYMHDLLCNAAHPAGETGLYSERGGKQSGGGG
jgi:sarcosine oxidase subunit gamma